MIVAAIAAALLVYLLFQYGIWDLIRVLLTGCAFITVALIILVFHPELLAIPFWYVAALTLARRAYWAITGEQPAEGLAFRIRA